MRIRTAVSLIVCSLLPVGISLAWGLHATGSATRASTSRESFLNDPSRAVSALAPQPAVSPSVAEPPLATSDWPSQRGDLGRRGHSDEQLDASALTEAWTWHSASPPEPAWPGPARWDAFAKLPGLKSMRNYDPAFHVSAEGDAVYFGSSSDDAVRCLDATSGEQRWLFRSGGPVRVAPTVFGSHVYFGSDDGAAYCLNKKSGELVWRHDLMPNATRILCNARLISPWPIRTGVHVADGVAYFGASLLPWRPSYLCAVDAKTGGAPEIGERDGTRFVRDLGTGWSLEGALLVSAESLIVPQGRIAPLIFERATGNPQGTLEGGGGSFCLLTENDQVLHGPGNKDGWITASEAGSRAKLASFSRGNAIVVRDKTAYMLSDSRLAALDISTQTLLWSRAVQTPFEIILAGDTLYCAGDGIVEARELSDGRLLWRGDVLGRVWGLAVARGRLLVSTDRGCISAFEAGDTKIPQPDERVVDEEGTELEPPPPVAKNLRSSTLLDRWVFQSDHLRETELAEDDPRTAPAFVNLGKGLAIRPVGRTQLQQAGALHALALDGRSGDLEVCSDMHQVAHPEKKISVTTTVRIDRAQAWGGLIGMAQDNGEYERGWMLGFRENRFGFALASKEGTGRLTWLLAPDGFTLGSWHVVTGTYDGRTMKLFVDGAEVASSAAESGDINYPETAYYHIGAYRDADEYFRVSGCIAELSVHAAALSSKDVAKLWNERKALLPRPVAVGEVKREEKPLLHSLKLARKASVRFIGPGRALVEWQLAEEASVNLHVTPEGGESAVIAGSGKTHNHSVLLSGLRDQTVYECVIISEDGKAFSKSFECDTHFDLFRGSQQISWQAAAQDPTITAIIDVWQARSPVQKGIAVVLGCSGTEEEFVQVAQLASRMDGVIVLTEDRQIAAYQIELAKLTPYGARLTVLAVPNEGDLALPNNFANLVLVSPFDATEGAELLSRGAYNLVRPDGGMLVMASQAATNASTGFTAWESVPRPGASHSFALRHPLEGSADWSHMYGLPDNSGFGGETLSGVKDTSGLELSWIGRPGPRYQTDRQNRKPAPLSTAGRLYLQGMNRVLVLDGYNGTLQWDVGLQGLQRFNIPRSSSNWCADRESLYLAMGDLLHVLEAKTGAVTALHTVQVPDAVRARAPETEWEWGYVAQQAGTCFGSAVRAGNQFTEWWGGEHWFDAKDGEKAKKVCSEALFAISKEDGELLWSRSVGRVIEPTIAISEGAMVFAECRNPAAMGLDSARVGDELWKDLWLVCLDAQSGALLWEREAKPLPGKVAIFLAAAEGTVVMVTSGLHRYPDKAEAVGEYAVYAFALQDGKSSWRKKFGWEADHHGKHLSRPSIVGGHLILRPMTFDLATGDELRNAFPNGHQCGSYACSSEAIFLRAGDMTVWNRETGSASSWSRLRPDCWISTIPAAGMLLSPEGGGGCSCGKWIQASMGFSAKRGR